MASQKFTLTTTPIQILDGSTAAYVQELRGKHTRFTCSPTQPDASTVPYCTILKNDLSVSEGFPLWAWTPTAETIELAVLTAEV